MRVTSQPFASCKLARNEPMMVLRKCPAWNGLAILGELNSMMTFFPLSIVLVPYLVSSLRIWGRINDVTALFEMKNCRNVPAATTFSTNGDSPNYHQHGHGIHT